jgi:Ca2+-binding EF-hand superfamily protein
MLSPFGGAAGKVPFVPFTGTLVDYDALEQRTHLSKKELVALHVEYRKLANRSGLMDLEAFRKSLGSLGLVQDALLCQRLFSVFNKSNTGILDFSEFARGLGCLTKGTVDEKLDFAFAMTDIDGSGEISFDELLLTVESMARIYSSMMGGTLHGEIDVALVRRAFNQLDRNGDGTITLDEYKRGMKRNPEFIASLQITTLGGNATAKAEQQIRKNLEQLLSEAEKTLATVRGLAQDAERLVLSLRGEDEDKVKELQACLARITSAVSPSPPSPVGGTLRPLTALRCVFVADDD